MFSFHREPIDGVASARMIEEQHCIGKHALTGPVTIRRIGPIDVTASSIADALTIMVSAVDAGKARLFGFCNAHTVNLARRDNRLVSALARATVFNDGLGVDIAGRMLYGSSFPANLNGTDLTPMLMEALASGRRRRRVFLLGSAPGVAEKAAAYMAEHYPRLDIVGCHHGFFAPSETPALIESIRSSAPDIVLVGMGQPLQEIWAANAMERLGTVVVCIGAFLDFCAGMVPRAPRLVRRMRMEWLYRLSLEPKRLAGRYVIGNAQFLIGLVREKMSAKSS